MRYMLWIAVPVLILLSVCGLAEANCSGPMGNYVESYPSGTACVNATWTKQQFWAPQWADGFSRWVRIIDLGVSNWRSPKTIKLKHPQVSFELAGVL